MKHSGKNRNEEIPLLSGEARPTYSTAAKDAFVKVLIKALDVLDPGHMGASHTNPAMELENAVDTATLYCNPELLTRMNDFRDAVLDASRGEGGDRELVAAARDHFTSGCRQALGTDD